MRGRVGAVIYDDDYDPSWWPESGALTSTAEQQMFRVCRALAASQEALAFCSQRMTDPFTDHPLSDDALLAIVEATKETP